MFFLPFHVDVPMARWPVTNFLFIVATVFVFGAIRWGSVPPESIEPYILKLGDAKGIYGHIFLHFGYLHIFGNMMFLWVFGNAICAKLGNISFFFAYVLLGCIAGIAHLLLDGGPAIGASGAVNAVVGMYLVLYPRNNVSCFYWFFFKIGTFSISGIWVILYWLVFDIWGAVSGGGSVAYWAHLGGFGAGFLLATVLLFTGLVEMNSTEESLYDTIRG